MALDKPSAQLESELQQCMRSALATRRPILHHLNADSTWLLQIPRPETAVKRGSRHYYNILIDPWLTGGQSDVASWFSQQFHAEPSAVQSIAEVEELARRNELLASGKNLNPANNKPHRQPAEEHDTDEQERFIDAVAVSHEFTDHCHKETLLEIHPDVPVFAIKEAASLIASWKHFRTVLPVNVFGAGGDTDWRSTSVPPLPEWVGISRLLQTDDVLNYHAALMITFNNNRRHGNAQAKLRRAVGSGGGGGGARATLLPDEDEERAEAVIYTPHGISSGDLSSITRASPQISTLAFLHGLHNVRVGTASGRTALQSNLGAHNGLKAQRMLNAGYWVSTHDEVKKGGGLVAWFIQRDVISVKDAVEQERRLREQGVVDRDHGELDEVLDSFEGTNWVDLRNGESLVLL